MSWVLTLGLIVLARHDGAALGSLLAGFLLQTLSPSAAMTVVAEGMAVTAVTATALAPIRHAGREVSRAQPSSAANAARSSR
jgi:hypothetical protein